MQDPASWRAEAGQGTSENRLMSHGPEQPQVQQPVKASLSPLYFADIAAVEGVECSDPALNVLYTELMEVTLEHPCSTLVYDWECRP